MDTPREQFIAACVEIAESLLPLGFKFTRSGPHVQRQEGEFAYRVSFHTSRYNTTDDYVALRIGAYVSSKRLKNWRAVQAHPLLVSDCFAGGLIENLFHPPRSRDWNVAGKSGAADLADAIATIQSVALPYFARFADPAKVCALLKDEELPEMGPSQVIEFLLCFADRAAADAALSRFFRARPELLADYHRHLAELRREALPKARKTGYAYELAFATIGYGLTPPSGRTN